MTQRAVFVGLGQDVAGDDGVGLIVARVLAARGLEVRMATDASTLLPLLEAGRRVVVIDAVVGGGVPGTVIELTLDALATSAVPLSSHGIGVADAIELARTLYGEQVLARLALIGVAIERPRAAAIGLSPAVERAVPRAAALAITLAGSP
jgi:hydrogenase maturation protease